MDSKHIKQHSKEDAQTLKWISLACSKDQAREMLTGIYISDGETVACDGFRLHIAPTPTALIEGEGETIKPVNTLSSTPRVEEFELIEGDYPDYKEIIPTGEPVFEIGVNKKMLADLKSMPGDNMIILSFYGDTQPIKVSSLFNEAVAVIMPMHKGQS